MNNKWMIPVVFLLLTGGCATSRYEAPEEYLKQRDYNQAIRSYLQLLNPHIRNGKRYIYYDREAVTGIGVAYWNLKNYRTAVKILSLVHKKDPSFGKPVFYLGLSMEAMGDDNRAMKYYTQYLDVNPYDPYRQVLMGRLDYLVKRQITRDVQTALQNETELDLASFPEKSLAVLYFMNVSDDPQWKSLQKGLAEMLITDLSQVEELSVVERLRLNAIVDELRLGSTGLVDQQTAPRLGKLLGARYLIKGSYMILPSMKLTMDANIFKADEIFLPTNLDFEGTLSQLFRIEKNLVLQILDYFGIQISIEQREKILEIPTDNIMAFISYCWGLDALDRDDYETAQDYFKEALGYDGNFQMARDRLMSPRIWQATHLQVPTRVSYEVSELIQTTPEGSAKMAYTPPPALLSPWNRLQRMSLQQNAGFIPGNDTRESFIEASVGGAEIIPELLITPPAPPPLP